MNNKERAEGRQLGVFLRLFNERYETDYVIGPAEPESSIADRKGISQSGEWSEMMMQLKDIKELDTSPFTESIMGKGTIVFDLNIFKMLTPKLQGIERKYETGAKDVVLILNVGVSEDWMKDYETPTSFIQQSNFKGIYCLGLPSNIATSGYIFPLKEVKLHKNVKI